MAHRPCHNPSLGMDTMNTIFLKSGQIPAVKPCQIVLNVITARAELIMKKERRWLKSAIAASTEVEVVMPWTRGQRRRPEAMKSLGQPLKATTEQPRASAAH